jgi:hypothetical protein
MSNVRTDDWTPLLSKLTSLLLDDEQLRSHLPPEALSAGWCGLPPASQELLLEVEQRLGLRLPPSYRSFLSITNGWHLFGSFIERLIPVDDVNWLRLVEPDTLAELQECYQEDDVSDEQYLDYDTPKNQVLLRHRYWPDCLLVSKGWDGEMILLNSKIVFATGEWEAIFFANWVPGNERYRSFRELAEATVRSQEFINESKSG